MEGNVKAYQTSDTLGKSQIDLVIKVYDGALAAFRQAKAEFSNEKAENGRQEIDKAKKFITHLYTTLDMEKGGEIAEQLSKLYSFVLNQTNIIEATKDLKMIDDNIVVLDNLRQGWIALKDQVKTANKESQPVKSSDSFTTSA